jgi:hypothetical protein
MTFHCHVIVKASGNSVRTLVPPKPLTVQYVFNTLKQIALEKGHAVRLIDIDLLTSSTTY